jgi:peptide/nickel transport system permease protein
MNFMLAFIMRRLGTLGVILFGSSFLLYNLAALSGDPAGELRASNDPDAPAQIAALTRSLQLDVPPPLRYFIWLKGILGVFVGKFTLGNTRTSEPVAVAVFDAIPTTLRLVTTAVLVAIVLGIAIGIITALRQYSRFDYSMTFVSFLLFSLPIFWVAVLLKQFMAIEFNNWLAEPTIAPRAMAIIGGVIGLIVASAVGGARKKFWKVFGITSIGTVITLALLLEINWFLKPALGPVGFFVASAGAALLITQLSVGLQHRPSLRAALSMSVLGLISYYPVNWLFERENQPLIIFGLLLLTIASAVFASIYFAKIDRGPVIRTAVLTGILSGLLMILDKLMRTWEPYFNTDAVNGRPVPTIGQRKALLETSDYWISLLDVLMHLVLPTIALTAISFAGYIRFSRGTMLEVLNQDYIRTARAKGLNERTVIMRHAFRNTMIPLTTIMVVDFAGILGGAIITERVFGWTGMGSLFNTAITSFDLNLLMGVFFLTGTLALLANLVADLLYSVMDPRIRVGAGK